MRASSCKYTETSAGSGLHRLIAVTGYSQEQDRMRAQAAGFDHHLVEPIEMKKLAAIISQASSV